MSDYVPRSGRGISADTLPEVPNAKSSSQQLPVVLPFAFAVKVGDAAPALRELLGKPLIVVFAPAAAHGTITISLRDARYELEKKEARAVLVVAGDPRANDDFVLGDADGSIHRKFGALDPESGRPRLSAFLIHAAGHVVGVFVPGEPERALRLALDALDHAR